MHGPVSGPSVMQPVSVTPADSPLLYTCSFDMFDQPSVVLIIPPVNAMDSHYTQQLTGHVLGNYTNSHVLLYCYV